MIRLVQVQDLPGPLLGTEWRSSSRRCRTGCATPPQRGSREAVLSTVGAWKDDPYLEDELKEIYRAVAGQ